MSTSSSQRPYTTEEYNTSWTDIATRAHLFELPLDYSNPGGQRLTIYAHEVVDKSKVHSDLPWFLYLQGGPGFQSPQPTSSYGPAWMRRVLEEYRVLFMDQRGMGQSSIVTYETIEGKFQSAAELAEYLTHFRADNIVRDAEEIRKVLTGGKPWTIYGQSFGGFCVTTYLSLAGEGVAAGLITGGLPPALRSADEVYQASLETALIKTNRAYARHPQLKKWIREIVDYLHDNEALVPNSGTRITPQWFQAIGFRLLETDFVDELYALCQNAWVTRPDGKKILSYGFRRSFELQHAFDTNPLYAVLHEAIYAHSDVNAGPTDWSAARMAQANSAFSLAKGSNAPVMLTGEMIYPFYFDCVKQLQPFKVKGLTATRGAKESEESRREKYFLTVNKVIGAALACLQLKEAAEILAKKTDWGRLYDFDALGRNQAPVAAAVYYEDAAVVREYSLETARAIQNCRVWITNEYEHNANKLGDGYKIMDRLIAMTRGAVHFAY